MTFWAPGALLMLVVPLLAGSALVRALCGCRGLAAASLGFPIGMGAMAVLFMASYMVGVPAGAWRLVELGLLVSTLVFAHRRGLFGRRKDQLPGLATIPGAASPWTGRAVLAALVLVAAAAALVQVASGLSNPHGDWNAWAIWNMHARFIFRDPTRGLLYLDGKMG